MLRLALNPIGEVSALRLKAAERWKAAPRMKEEFPKVEIEVTPETVEKAINPDMILVGRYRLPLGWFNNCTHDGPLVPIGECPGCIYAELLRRTGLELAVANALFKLLKNIPKLIATPWFGEDNIKTLLDLSGMLALWHPEIAANPMKAMQSETHRTIREGNNWKVDIGRNPDMEQAEAASCRAAAIREFVQESWDRIDAKWEVDPQNPKNKP